MYRQIINGTITLILYMKMLNVQKKSEVIHLRSGKIDMHEN